MSTATSKRKIRLTTGESAKTWISWLPLIVLPAVLIATRPESWPRWAFMWLLATVVFFCFKWLTWWNEIRPETTLARQLAWWLAWPGMDPVKFLRLEPFLRRPAVGEWGKATFILAFGCLLFWSSGILLARHWDYLGAWCAMYGLLFMLHFGIFHLMSCAWRAAGVDAQPIMNKPLLSRTSSEFWGRRWNLAFRNAAHAAVFRPIVRRWSERPAILGVFVFSGVVHELAISIPAESGYGLPTLYFLWQAATVMIRIGPHGNRLTKTHKMLGRAFLLISVVAPSPILFHPPFLKNVIVPFLRAIFGIEA